jgi:hypothetical protein
MIESSYVDYGGSMSGEVQSKLIEAKTIVVNITKEEYDVYIGRPSKWGNPFKTPRDGTRDECVAKYREWIINQPNLMAEVRALRGKRLGCFCAPRKCHGDILAALADGESDYGET